MLYARLAQDGRPAGQRMRVDWTRRRVPPEARNTAWFTGVLENIEAWLDGQPIRILG